VHLLVLVTISNCSVHCYGLYTTEVQALFSEYFGLPLSASHQCCVYILYVYLLIDPFLQSLTHSIIHSLIRSFIHHRRYVIIATDSVLRHTQISCLSFDILFCFSLYFLGTPRDLSCSCSSCRLLMFITFICYYLSFHLHASYILFGV
jgi:hypothetical protein